MFGCHGGLDDGLPLFAARGWARRPGAIGLGPTRSIAPYGVFKTKDGADILISIQSDPRSGGITGRKGARATQKAARR